MKTIKLFILFAIGGMLTGCYYDDTDIKQTIDTNKAIQDSININTSEQQGNAMIQTLDALAELKDQVFSYLNDSLSIEFQSQMNDLQSQIIVLKNSNDSITSWVQNTYTTLEQYEALSLLLSATKEDLVDAMTNMDSTLRADITGQINSLEASMTTWVTTQLRGFYTISEIDSLLQIERSNYTILMAEQNSAILDSLAKVNSSLLDSISGLRNDICANQEGIDSVRAQLTREYQSAISTAINEYDGQIRGYIKMQIDSIDNKIHLSIDSIRSEIDGIKTALVNITLRIDEMDSRLDSLEIYMNGLLSQIQSVTYLPQYTDELVKVNKIIASIDTTFNIYTDTIKSIITGNDSIYVPHNDIVKIDTLYEYRCDPIEFLVRPEECVDALDASMITIKSIAPQVRHAQGINANPSSDFEIESIVKGDALSQNGIIQITLKDNEALRNWYESTDSATIALFIDNEDTNTHINSGFVVQLTR